MPIEAGWQCPACGRRFLRRTKEHSCAVTSIEDHLARADAPVRAAFDALMSMLGRVGSFHLIPVKTMITLAVDRNFGGIVVRRSRLDVGFFLARLETGPRITKVEKLSARKIAHHVDVRSAADVDAQLEEWFREAIAFGRVEQVAPRLGVRVRR